MPPRHDSIETRNPALSRLIGEIEHVASRSKAPLLLTGPTGAGKTWLARRIHEMKRRTGQAAGPLVEVNCAISRDFDAASGLLFLDEIDALGLSEQAMVLRAIEDGNALLIAATNRDLGRAAAEGRFRGDLLARLAVWTFALPGLAERREDIEPNIDYELDRFAELEGARIAFDKAARRRYLAFAAGPHASWPGNFRDLSASITRMATLAPEGRIDLECADAEIARLKRLWAAEARPSDGLDALLGPERIAELDPFDRVQLAQVIEVCRKSRSLSEAGRSLFAASRAKRTSSNDADRLRKYLARFALSWQLIAD